VAYQAFEGWRRMSLASDGGFQTELPDLLRVMPAHTVAQVEAVLARRGGKRGLDTIGSMPTPIVQFGTSRFLLAHVALFVSQALRRGADGQALGSICVVQTTHSADSARRLAALAAGGGYPVHVRGLQHGAIVDACCIGDAVREALQADRDWPRLQHKVAIEATVIVSNTADRGYQLEAADDAALLAPKAPVPHSFPAKLLVLLHRRWQLNRDAPLSIFPCELIERNGEVLRELLVGLAHRWAVDGGFVDWLRTHCVWANSLVDRIVSAPLQPVGAVAEPYALWAVEAQPRLQLPCRHEDILLTDDLARHARLKLFLLNGGHSFLAERWLRERRCADETVLQAMHDERLRAELEALWHDEMLPVFAVLGLREAAVDYLEALRERLLNPFLEHRLAEIAQNHAQKKQRRFAPLRALAEQQGLPQPRLRAALSQPD
jgi:tagaturonate reductase